MAKRKSKRKEALETVIKEQAFETIQRFLENHRPKDITVEAIAHEASIPLGTLYRYFRSKGDMIAYVIVRFLEPFEKESIRIAESDMPVVDKLYAFVERNLKINDDDLFVALCEDSSGGSVIPIQELQESRRRTAERLTKIMEEGIHQGILRDVSPRKLRLTLTGINQAFSSQRLFAPHNPSIKEDAKDIMDMFLTGAGADKR